MINENTIKNYKVEIISKNIYTKTKLIDRNNLENFNKLGLIQKEDMWKLS